MRQYSRSNYLAFLLRLWRENGTINWRATLESPHTGQRYGFSDLRDLFAFLEERTGEKENNKAPDNKRTE